MDQPAYFPLPAEKIPVVTSPDGLISLSVVTGQLLDQKGIIPSLSPVNAASVVAKRGGEAFIPIPSDHNAFIYLLDGKVRIEGYGLIDGLNAALFESDGEGIGVEALEDTRLLLLSGKPLGEKVVTHGPFVMNSETEILEAMRDYQQGKMGVLIEDRT
jgi:redox-sensitive bicupin YhaK (pirin superfamily)